MVDRPEVQQKVLARPFARDANGTAIPDGSHEVGLADTAGRGFRSEWHENAAGQFPDVDAPLEPRVRPVDLELPFAVQV